MGEQKKDETGPGTTFIAISTVAGLIVTIVLSWLAWRSLGRPIEELPGWIEAGATVAAVGAAIIAGFYAARAYGLEHRREKRWEDDKRSEQASQVVAWPLGPGTIIQSRTKFLSGVAATLRNASNLPVNDVRLTFYMEVDEHSAVEVGSWATDFVPPETTQPVNVTLMTHDRERIAVPGDGTPRILVELEFRDLANGSWRRSAGGHLEQVLDHPRP